MTEKYPYLNSVVFDSPKVPNGSVINTLPVQVTETNSFTGSVYNINDQFQDVDLSGFSENSSESPATSEKYSWRLGTDSLEMLSDNNDLTPTAPSSDQFISSFPNHVFNCSSISSLSSLTSNTDLSIPHNLSNADNANSNGTSDIKTNNRISSNDKESKTNFISQISQLVFNRSNKSKKSSIETPLKSTTCLILNDRPIGLPPKSTDESKRHQDEYNQLISNIKKKEKQQNYANKALLKSKINQEERQYQLTHVWRNFILPNWFHQQSSQYVRHLWWEGIPTSVRDKVWRHCIPNTLKLTKTHYDNFLSQMQERIERYLEPVPNKELPTKETVPSNAEKPCDIRKHSNGTHISPTADLRSSAYDLYISETVSIHNKRSSSISSYSANISSNKHSASSDVDIRQILLNTIKLDVSRTFPSLNLFQNGGPHHDLLYQLLGAYACYRPDIGYVQGMSFLAAILILVMNVEDAFICFANILELPCHHAFYALDESEFTVYLESFKLSLFTHLPQLAQHFIQHKLDVNIFLCDWLFTIYSRALPLETALRVWDMFCRDGEAALFRAGLGILRCYEMQLLNSDFEEMAGFLTGQMPESLSASVLVDEMREIKLYPSNFSSTIEQVRSRLIKNKNSVEISDK